MRGSSVGLEREIHILKVVGSIPTHATVTVAEWLRRRIVAPVYVGSNPIRDPKFKVMDKDFVEKFLMDRDDTGRFIVKSRKTGKTYFVEPVDGDEKTCWGDYNPTTKTFETSNYGKYKGSVKPSESLVTEENGFDKIHTLGPGESPLEYIERIDEEYYKNLI